MSHVAGELATARFDYFDISDQQSAPDIGQLYAWYLPTLVRDHHAQLSITDYRYDIMGRMQERVDAVGIATQWSYDERGRRLSQIEAVGTDCERRTEWDYDAVGNNIAIRHPRYFNEGLPATTHIVKRQLRLPLDVN